MMDQIVAFLMDPTVARAFYGSSLVIAGALAWRSHDHVLQRIGLWIGLEWFLDNFMFDQLGNQAEIVPGCALMGLVMVNLWVLGRRYRSMAVWEIFGLYVASAAVDLSMLFALWSDKIDSLAAIPFYRFVLSLLYLGRLWLLGGRSVVVIRTRPVGRPSRAHSGTGARS